MGTYLFILVHKHFDDFTPDFFRSNFYIETFFPSFSLAGIDDLAIHG